MRTAARKSQRLTAGGGSAIVAQTVARTPRTSCRHRTIGGRPALGAGDDNATGRIHQGQCKDRRSFSFHCVARAPASSPLSEERAKRICELARQMGYSPSVPARSLVTRDTATIGMVITHVSDPFLGRLVSGVEETAQANGYSVFLSSSYRNADIERNVIRDFYERRVTGIIVNGSQIDAGYRQLHERYPLPINFRNYIHSIATDNLSGTRQAVEHLVQLGHRRIAYVSNRHSFRTDLEREEGYKTTPTKYGIPIDGALLVQGDGTLEGGLRGVKRLLALPLPPSTDNSSPGRLPAGPSRNADVAPVDRGQRGCRGRGPAGRAGRARDQRIRSCRNTVMKEVIWPQS